MKIKYVLLFWALSAAFGIGRNIEKTVLLPADKNVSLGIENIYISPQPDQPPLIAFYGEDEQHIYIYHTAEKSISRVKCKTSESYMSAPPVSFVTFCWDQECRGKFAAVFSTYGQRLVFFGENRGNKELKKSETLSVKTTAFTYRDEVLYFLDLDSNRVRRIPARFFSSTLKPDKPGLVIADCKWVPRTGQPYFVLRNVSKNNYGIYEGKGFKKVVDDPFLDELYPHYSQDGTRLGYIERAKGTGTSRVCIKAGKNVKKSEFTFALEENALLREYKRMFWVGNKLYYFAKEPDLNSRHMGYGLRVLSIKEDRSLPYGSRLISKNEKILDILSNKKGICEDLQDKPTVGDIVVFEYKGHPCFVFLTDFGSFKIKVGNKRNWVSTKAVVIADSLLSGEE